MFRDLEFLLQLQEIDLRIHEQELAKEQLPATVRDLEQAVSKVQKGLEAAKNKLAEAEKELKNFDDKIFTAEIETQKNMVATSEGRKNKLTEEVNQLKAAVDAAQQELDKISSENAPVITDLKSKIEAIDSIIADIVKERDAVVPSITKSSMRTYDQIIKRRKTAKVISSVDHARTCTVCFKVLEPHIISEVRRSTQLILCQNCGSILVWTGNRGQGGAPEA
jgi:predicted  nucleic acid-binding Zn-ribbon protein